MKSREADRRIRNIINQHTINKKVTIAEDAFKKENAERPLYVEKRVENVLIDIPDNLPLRELPAVVSALHYYKDAAEGIKADAWSSQRKNYKLEVTCNVHVACENKIINEVVARILNIPAFDRMALPRHPLDYDMYCRIDMDVANAFRGMNKYHAAAAYGIMLGCEAMSLFPIPVDKIIDGVEYDTAKVDILVLDDAYGSYTQAWQWIGEAFSTLRVSRAADNINSFRAMIGAINQAQMVVGPTSLYTYLACVMRKPTLEIYPIDISRNWLSKWDNPIYNMYRSTSEIMDKTKLLKGVSYQWAKSLALLSRQRVALAGATAPIQTVPSPFTAGSAITASQT